MSQNWVKEIKAMSDDELIKDVEERMRDLYYKDLWITEMLIRILKRTSSKVDNTNHDKEGKE